MDKVNGLIESNDPILTRYAQILAILEEGGPARRMKLKPEQVLCHSASRSSLGLSPYDVHRTGRMTAQVGALLRELDSVCIELPSGSKAKDAVVAFNQKLYDAGDGLLAPVLGSEKFASLAGGHIVAFCRAANHECRTTEVAIQNPNGGIDAAKLRRDPVFKIMLDEGWEWVVLTSTVEERFPKLSDCLQRAKKLW